MRISLRPTYANVTSTLALVVALGGTAVAAGLPARSVGTLQLKSYAVTTGKIANRDVTNAKIAPGAVGPGNLSPAARALARSGPASPGTAGGAASNLPNMTNNSGTVGVYASVNGSGPASSGTQEVSMISPPRPMTARNLRAEILNDIPAGATVYVQITRSSGFLGQGFEVLSCTIGFGNNKQCSASGPATIPPSSFLYVLIAVHGTAGPVVPAVATWGLTLIPA